MFEEFIKNMVCDKEIKDLLLVLKDLYIKDKELANRFRDKLVIWFRVRNNENVKLNDRVNAINEKYKNAIVFENPKKLSKDEFIEDLIRQVLSEIPNG